MRTIVTTAGLLTCSIIWAGLCLVGAVYFMFRG
jgi:uncharacterized protein (DUF486 family)